jgi:hypothetical protein
MTQAGAGPKSKLPAPAKAGAGHFKWLPSFRNVLVVSVLLLLGAFTAQVRGNWLEGDLASGREAAGMPYRDGPPLGFSGGFGEDHCQACHTGEKVNASPGGLTISVPQRYAPGQAYTVTVTLKRPSMKMGGFQLTARFADDSTQAGTLALADGRPDHIKITTDRGLQYAYHRSAGTQLTSAAMVRWTLRWTAPTGKRTVHFHAAANAANADESQSGDFVYTARALSRPR